MREQLPTSDKRGHLLRVAAQAQLPKVVRARHQDLVAGQHKAAPLAALHCARNELRVHRAQRGPAAGRVLRVARVPGVAGVQPDVPVRKQRKGGGGACACVGQHPPPRCDPRVRGVAPHCHQVRHAAGPRGTEDAARARGEVRVHFSSRADDSVPGLACVHMRSCNILRLRDVCVLVCAKCLCMLGRRPGILRLGDASVWCAEGQHARDRCLTLLTRLRAAERMHTRPISSVGQSAGLMSLMPRVRAPHGAGRRAFLPVFRVFYGTRAPVLSCCET